MKTSYKFKYNYNDSISGGSIWGQAGNIHNRGIKREDNIQLKILEFFKSAVCIINLPITILKKQSSKNVVVDGLKGHKIYGESKKLTKIKKVKNTGRHTQQEVILKGHAFCQINIPIHSKR